MVSIPFPFGAVRAASAIRLATVVTASCSGVMGGMLEEGVDKGGGGRIRCAALTFIETSSFFYKIQHYRNGVPQRRGETPGASGF